MTFWVVRIETGKAVRYATYQAQSPLLAEALALINYPGAMHADVVREEGSMERQVREAFGQMYEEQKS